MAERDVAERQGYLGLGSNVGERREHLEAAVAALPAHGVRVLAASSVYETEPVGEVLEQRDFLNAAVRIGTELGPEELLDACKAIERELGRGADGEPYVRHGPRRIDVDLLLLGDLEYASERLRLPHEQVTSRRFVLVPLLELDPELATPGGARLRDALDALGPGQDVRRAGDPLPVPHAGVQRVQLALHAAGSAGRVAVLGESTRTAAEAAAALGCPVGAIASSLVFATQEGGDPVLVVTSGAHRVDTAKVGAELGVELRRADADLVREATGFPIGGVAPVALARPLRTVVDRALAAHDTVWAAAGTPRAVFETTYAELLQLTGGTPADVA